MKKFIINFIFISLFISCSNGSGNRLPEEFTLIFDHETFMQQRQLWLEQDFRNYSFFQESDFITHEVIVIDGEHRYFRSTYRDRLYLPEQYSFLNIGIPQEPYLDSITNIYTYIEYLTTSDILKGDYTLQLDIEYDSTYHYPAFIHQRVRYIPYNYRPGGPASIEGIKFYNFALDPVVPEETSLVFDRELFNRNREYWIIRNIQDYTFKFYYTTYSKDDNYRWVGDIVVKDGKVSEINSFDPPPDAEAQAWIGTIDEMYAKIEEEAGNYTTGGRIEIIYDHSIIMQLPIPSFITFLYISADSPSENFAFEIDIRNFEQF